MRWVCVCVCFAWGGVGGEGGEWMRGWGFGLYQGCDNRGNVGCVSVFGLRWCGWCGWCRWGVGWGLGPGSGGVDRVMSVLDVSLDSLYIWQIQAYV